MEETLWSGYLDRVDIEPGPPGEAAIYHLCLDQGGRHPLNDCIGQGVVISTDGGFRCAHCGSTGRRGYGGPYCYRCFTTLARCDLCVVSPDRCHYHQGTCREPEWGESFCMQPHVVYLANSSGIKVGITRRGREMGRWLDQGAIQGLKVLDAATRQAAGLAEVLIAERLPDRTDWRRMLRGDVPELDLPEAARALDVELPPGVSRAPVEQVLRLHYPLPREVAVTQLLRLAPGRPLSGNLLGLKGQYLVLTSGALNLARCAGYQVSFTIRAPFEPAGEAAQLGLF